MEPVENGSPLPKHIGEIANLDRYHKRTAASPNAPRMSSPEPPIAPLFGSIKMQTMFSTIYHGLTSRFNLKGIEIQLIAAIISLSRKTGWCYAGEATLALLCGTTTTTIEKHLKNLHSRGILERGGKSQKGTIKRRLADEPRDYLNTFIQRRIDTRNK